ncbi:Hsp70 family protein [Virgisporangium ochraceum]|uniref:Hsp70 family protein n=1 Tax=Virgisporangium ochraceum TaxID=65505 RepID=UPI0035A22C10
MRAGRGGPGGCGTTGLAHLDLSRSVERAAAGCPAVGGGSARSFVSEPVAAANYFTTVAGHRIAPGAAALVYDLGAGTFDASVVRRTDDGFEVLASRGRSDAGGLDIDAAIVAHLRAGMVGAEQWSRLERPTTAGDRRARVQLWDGVRRGKERCSRAVPRR